jgi:hypothetical protein
MAGLQARWLGAGGEPLTCEEWCDHGYSWGYLGFVGQHRWRPLPLVEEKEDRKLYAWLGQKTSLPVCRRERERGRQSRQLIAEIQKQRVLRDGRKGVSRASLFAEGLTANQVYWILRLVPVAYTNGAKHFTGTLRFPLLVLCCFKAAGDRLPVAPHRMHSLS